MVDERLLSILACPWCLGALESVGERLTCRVCRASYPVREGIPHMLVEEAELFCAFCGGGLRKVPPHAQCDACRRRWRMDRRVQGDMKAHAIASLQDEATGKA